MKTRFLLFISILFLSVVANNSTLQAQNNKEQIIGDWEFNAITLVSPKTGHLITLEEQEINIMKLCVANYGFKTDGSIVLNEKYMTGLGITKATWKLNSDITEIEITYHFSEDSSINKGNTNNYEKFPWKIDAVSDQELTINLWDMFIVKLLK